MAKLNNTDVKGNLTVVGQIKEFGKPLTDRYIAKGSYQEWKFVDTRNYEDYFELENDHLTLYLESNTKYLVHTELLDDIEHGINNVGYLDFVAFDANNGGTIKFDAGFDDTTILRSADSLSCNLDSGHAYISMDANSATLFKPYLGPGAEQGVRNIIVYINSDSDLVFSIYEDK